MDDLPFCRLLYGSFRADELCPVPWPDVVKEQFLDSQFALQHRHFATVFDKADFLILEWNGRAVGRLYLDRSGTDWLVIDIGFLPEVRLHGLGESLLRDVLTQATKAGAASVGLHVDPTNLPALCLYRKLGFVSVEQDGPYIRMHWQPVSIS